MPPAGKHVPGTDQRVCRRTRPHAGSAPALQMGGQSGRRIWAQAPSSIYFVFATTMSPSRPCMTPCPTRTPTRAPTRATKSRTEVAGTHRNSTLSLFTWHATPRHHSKTTTHNTHLRITMFFSNKMLPHFPVVCLLSMCTQECGPSRFDTHPSGGRLFYDLGRGCNSCIFTGHKYAIPDFVCRPNLNSIYCQLHKSTREHHFEFRGVGYQICTSNIFIYLN